MKEIFVGATIIEHDNKILCMQRVRYSNGSYEQVTAETTFTDFVYDMRIIFIANDAWSGL